jgi:hypothetical protein
MPTPPATILQISDESSVSWASRACVAVGLGSDGRRIETNEKADLNARKGTSRLPLGFTIEMWSALMGSNRLLHKLDALACVTTLTP